MVLASSLWAPLIIMSHGARSDLDLGRQLQHLVQGLGLGLGQDHRELVLKQRQRQARESTQGDLTQAGVRCQPAAGLGPLDPFRMGPVHEVKQQLHGMQPAGVLHAALQPAAAPPGPAARVWRRLGRKVNMKIGRWEGSTHHARLLGAAERSHDGALQLRHLAELDLVGLQAGGREGGRGGGGWSSLV